MIPTISFTTPSRVSEFNSALSAIAYAREFDRKHRPASLELCQGRLVTNVRYGGGAFAVDFDNGLSLVCAATERLIACAIEDVPTPLAPPKVDGSVIRLCSTQFEYVWERETVARSLLGRVFQNLFIGQCDVHLYTQGSRIVTLQLAIDREDQQPFLYWFLDD